MYHFFSIFANYMLYKKRKVKQRMNMSERVCLISGMMKHVGAVAMTAMMVVVVSFVTSCGNSEKRHLNALLVELAADDATIDAADWTEITDYIDGQKNHFKNFYTDGQIDYSSLEDYISDFFSRRRPPLDVAFESVDGNNGVAVKFYLERSGSMTPYDTSDGDGAFKAAIVSMLNSLPDDGSAIDVVNDSIYPYPQGTRQFVADSNIFESTRGIGNANYTDFAAIFDNILKETRQRELSILVTDLIYSTRQMEGTNAEKIFAEVKGMTQSVFKSEVKNKSMLVLKMTGMYSGKYYPYTQAGGVAYKGQRPYYIVIVGDNNLLKRLPQDADYAAFCRLTEMRGYENMYLFTANDMYEPYYSLLLAGDDIRGRFQPARGQGDQITKIEGAKTDRNSGDLQLALAVDLSGMLIDDGYLTDKANYEVDGDGDIEIVDIRPLNKKDVTPAEKKYLKTATHIFTLRGSELRSHQDVSIKLMNRLPEWVELTSTDDDRNTADEQFAKSTFGLKYLMQGIYDSYRRYSDGEPYYFELDLEINR